jgi:hypothetical protein
VAVTAFIYPKGMFIPAFNKEIDLLDDAIKCMLTTSTYVPDQDTHDYKNDVTNEVSGTGYTATGVTLANDTLTYTAGTNVLMYDADDAVWTGATITARVAVVYDSTPATDATRPLLCYQLSDADIISTAGEFRVAWAAAGIFTITAA